MEAIPSGNKITAAMIIPTKDCGDPAFDDCFYRCREFAINSTIPRQTNKVIKLQIFYFAVGTELLSSLLLGKK